MMLKEIDFLPDLEAGIRAAWRDDRAASPVRLDLISLCVGIHPFAKYHYSFIDLLEEVPEFAVCYVKALLGCPEMQRVESPMLAMTTCKCCGKQLFDSKGALVSRDIFSWAPTSLFFFNNCPLWFCSRACYNAGIPGVVV